MKYNFKTGDKVRVINDMHPLLKKNVIITLLEEKSPGGTAKYRAFFVKELKGRNINYIFEEDIEKVDTQLELEF
jgi:hypothetical protein